MDKKTIILLSLVCVVSFSVGYISDIDIIDINELPKEPNSETVCGKGTEERSDGRCYPKLLNYM